MSPSCQVSEVPEEYDPNREFFFPDLEEFNINKLPPEEVRILDLIAAPYSDNKRVLANIEMTPYQQRPHLEVAFIDPQGKEISAINIIEPLNWKMEFTMHLRGERQDGEYMLAARLFYPPRDEEDPKLARVDLPVEDTDRRIFKFEIPEKNA